MKRKQRAWLQERMKGMRAVETKEKQDEQREDGWVQWGGTEGGMRERKRGK